MVFSPGSCLFWAVNWLRWGGGASPPTQSPTIPLSLAPEPSAVSIAPPLEVLGATPFYPTPAKVIQAAAVGILPQNGWWWNPAEGGRGFAIERQGDQIFIAAFLYEVSGAATWYVSTLQQQPNGVYAGNFTRYAGGQTLLGAFKAPTSSTTPTSVSLFFSAPDKAALFVNQNDGSGSKTINIERFPISSPGFAASNAGFDTGWWWNEAEGGRGYFVEVQGSTAFIGSFMYGTNGEPIWYVSTATLTGSTSLSGVMQQYSGGQSIQGAFKSPVAGASPGTMKFDFSTSAAASMTLPNNAKVAVSRFWYNTPASVLAGRAWTAGTLIEQDDNPVYASETAIDDLGRTVTVFLKSNGTRAVLYATRGTPNAAGVAPTWTTPIAIDLVGGVPKNGMTSNANYFSFGVASAPNGNAVSYWYNTEPCTSSTYNTVGDCTYYYTSRFLVASGNWEAPVRVGDQPGNTFKVRINNNGDVAARVDGWVRTTGNRSYSSHHGVVWRPNGAAAYTRRAFNDATLAAGSMDMDGAGNMLFVAEASQNSTTDIVAYRGTMSGGFGANQILDTRGSVASLDRVAVGTGGQQVVLWSQNNGTSDAIYAATSPSASGTWTNQALVFSYYGSDRSLVVSDEGVIFLIDRANSFRFVWRDGVWSNYETLPDTTYFGSGTGECGAARNGNLVCMVKNTGFCAEGRWIAYDVSRNVSLGSYKTFSNISNCPAGGIVWSRGLSSIQLSVSGIAAMTLLNKFDVLPAVGAISGDGRNVTNLWGAFLK